MPMCLVSDWVTEWIKRTKHQYMMASSSFSVSFWSVYTLPAAWSELILKRGAHLMSSSFVDDRRRPVDRRKLTFCVLVKVKVNRQNKTRKLITRNVMSSFFAAAASSKNSVFIFLTILTIIIHNELLTNSLSTTKFASFWGLRSMHWLSHLFFVKRCTVFTYCVLLVCRLIVFRLQTAHS